MLITIFSDRMIELKNVSKVWKDFKLKNVNLKLDKKYNVILGPSGSGKSVILKCICGILKVDSGRIYYNNDDITDMPPESRNFGYVPQNYCLFPHMNVYKNIEYGLKLKKIGKLERERRIKNICDFLNISHLLKRYPKSLSGGEQQRVALGRALVLNPKLLLLDEPTSALDLSNKENIIQELKKISDLVPIIHITHDLDEGKILGDYIVVLDDGKVLDQGVKTEIFDNPKNIKMAKLFRYNIIKINGTIYGVKPSNITLTKSDIKNKIKNKNDKNINNSNNDNNNNNNDINNINSNNINNTKNNYNNAISLIGEIIDIYDLEDYYKIILKINENTIITVNYYHNTVPFKINEKVIISFNKYVILKDNC